tara:strand:- start:5422 stop:6552 length:1131 start_codon:yes stop_codon:yes gene_type:complete
MPLIIIMFIIFSGLLIFFVMDKLTDIKSLAREKEIDNFVQSLNNLLKKQSARSYGSSDIITLSLPVDIESVCFVDSSKEMDRFAKKGLSSRLSMDKNKNFFLSPIEKNPTYWLDNIELEESNPLCVRTKQGKLSLLLTSTGENSLVESKESSDMDTDCVSVIYNGAPEDKIDIVFLGYGYNKIEGFTEDINNYINNVFSVTEPFKDGIDRFNFFRVDNLNELDCSVESFIFCDEFSVKNLASECPNDYIFVLVDRSKVKDILDPVRSSAFSNLAKINTADNELVLLHEFSHTFADLDDEYTDDSYYQGFDASDSLNCDFSGCPKWKGVEGAECFEGCSLNEFYRSSKESIMKNYYRSEEFGVWNSKVIEDNIGEYE